MSCGGRASNFEVRKAALINVNIWKSKFLNLWVEYGTMQDVDGVECLGKYRIDGDEEGPHKMSNHLRQSDMWEQTQNDDIARVDLYFNLNKLVEIDQDAIDAWIADMQDKATALPYDELRYELVDNKVESHGFYNAGDLVVDPFYDTLSSYIAQKKLADIGALGGDLSYAEAMDVATLNTLIEGIADHTVDFDGNYEFDVDEVEDAVRDYMVENALGVNILEDLVTNGSLIGIGAAGAGRTYYLPLANAKKMNGFAFIELVTRTLDFRIKKEGGFWNFIKRFAKAILAGIAIFYQQYWLAASLLVGFVADISGIKSLRILSQVLALFSGDFTSFADVGLGEALSLLSNVYSIYLELEYRPDGEIVEETNTKSTQKMFYRASYSAYNDIHCYKRLISVRYNDDF